MHGCKRALLILALLLVPGAAMAGFGFSFGSDDVPVTSHRGGPPAVIGNLLLVGGGNILLVGGGNLTCVGNC